MTILLTDEHKRDSYTNVTCNKTFALTNDADIIPVCCFIRKKNGGNVREGYNNYVKWTVAQSVSRLTLILDVAARDLSECE